MARTRAVVFLCLLGLGAFSTFTFTSTAMMAFADFFLFLAGIIYFSPKHIVRSKSYWILLAFVIACAISVLTNTDIIETPVKQILKLSYFVVALISIPALALWLEKATTRQKKTLIGIFLFSVTLATVAGAIGLWTGFNPIKWKPACHNVRSCGLYSQYMTYGYGLSMALVLMIGARVHAKRFSEFLPRLWILDLVIVINMAGLFLSYTRGAWLGLLIGAPLLFFPRSPKKFILIAIVGACALMTTLAISPSFRQKLLDRERSNSERLSFFTTAVYAAKEKPLFGWGYKNFESRVIRLKEKYSLPHPERGGHGHSNYFEHLGSTGFVGLSLLLLFFGFWMFEAYHTNPIVFGFIGNIMISGHFQYTLGDGENTMVIMTVYSLFIACNLRNTKPDWF